MKKRSATIFFEKYITIAITSLGWNVGKYASGLSWHLSILS
ncbi:hypothetical protein [Bathymodiolus thermophilus thioautotrophic gill symbiont]|uniref:Uncharacterized protein n=1 Tax=Bathymodiolus thermophilus thioautotrophic gill symbiont TaxID=2360 RepID=A0A8H8XDI7_9GAMM|nr:hypothetical protein [Bathymodiolus thermophilus thioautotrophic gill symbiont]CAB5498596.1 hypothetical protein THERMOS_873 [Bathymodiolus thermophilus thioautotrophic gill symbiont]